MNTNEHAQAFESERALWRRAGRLQRRFSPVCASARSLNHERVGKGATKNVLLVMMSDSVNYFSRQRLHYSIRSMKYTIDS